MSGQCTFFSYSRPPADLTTTVLIDVWYVVPGTLLLRDYKSFSGTILDAGHRALEWIHQWMKKGRQAGELWPREIEHILISNPGAPTGTFSTYSLAGFEHLVRSAAV